MFSMKMLKEDKYFPHSTFIFIDLVFDPVSPQPVIAVTNLAEESSIQDMVFVGPSSQLFEEWPETGEPYFLNQNSVKKQLTFMVATF